VPAIDARDTVMLFRALFWIAVVAVLMPREPDLGLGRPGLTSAFGQSLRAGLPAKPDCADYAKACTTALGVLDDFQSFAVKNLAQVKADIESEEARPIRRHAAMD
jgi:hypothetical protein